MLQRMLTALLEWWGEEVKEEMKRVTRSKVEEAVQEVFAEISGGKVRGYLTTESPSPEVEAEPKRLTEAETRGWKKTDWVDAAERRGIEDAEEMTVAEIKAALL
jgi:hypothetical protein